MKENRGFGSKSMSKGIATSAAVLLLLCIAAAAMVPTASASGWDYYRVITIDNNQVSGSSDLSSFPVLINHTADWLKYNEGGDHVQQADGYDIVFTDSINANKLDFEIEKYDGTAGTLVAWVRIPTLDHNDNTSIRLWYGNPNATDWSNATGVWDDDYKAVWHLLGDGTTSLPDATSNSNTGTKTAAGEPANTAGPIDGAQVFDGTDDYVDCGNDASLNITDAITVEAWVKRSSKSNFERILSNSIDADSYAYEVGVDFTNPDKWRIRLNGDAVTLLATMGGDAGEWVHITYSYDKDLGSDNMKIYENGVLLKSGDYSASLTNHGSLRTNRMGKNDGWLNSAIDEVRISDSARSADWIATSYNNQNSPSTFYSVADVTPAPEGTNPTPDPSALVLFAAGITMLAVFFGRGNKRKK